VAGFVVDDIRSPSVASSATPLSEVLGVELRGLDLSSPLEAGAERDLMHAFLTRHLVVVRDQSLSTDQQHALTLVFGEAEGSIAESVDGKRYPIVNTVTNFDASGNPSANPYTKSNYFWHTDKAYQAAPCMLTMLHAVELPPHGGETKFANMLAAYIALPEATKRRIDPLQAVHSLKHMRKASDSRQPSRTELERSPPVSHPLVRTHPATGARSLYIGIHCAGIVGMADDEARVLLAELEAHATQPQFIYTHTWRAGDLVFWDNRCLMHRGLTNFDMAAYRRVLNRSTVKGDVPY